MKNNFLKSPTGSADALRVLLNFWLEPGIFANLFSSLFGTVSRWRRRRSPCFPDQGRGHGPRGRTRLHQHGRSQGASQYGYLSQIYRHKLIRYLFSFIRYFSKDSGV